MKIVVAGTELKFNYISGFLFLAVLTLLVYLGFWQLDRAEEKRVFFSQQQQSRDKGRVDLSSLVGFDSKAFRYRKIQITGRYDQDHQYLIDNQIVSGQAGYFVMTPFVIEGINKAVLVNRGWVSLNKNRRVLPNIRINTIKNTISGRINNFPVVGIQLAGAEIPTENWPSVVQVVDVDVLSAKLGYSLLPFQIELDSTMSDGYVRDWKENTVMRPEKHVAYAVQWFALAITVTILFIGLSRKSK